MPASGAPLDARIVIDTGDKPVVEFLGRKTFFTELIPQGPRSNVPIAPGTYGFTVSAGAGVLATDALVQVEVVIRARPPGAGRTSGRVRSAGARLVLPPTCTIMPTRPKR